MAFTDANWGPQDASHPPKDRVITISEDFVRSLLGHVVIRCDGPVAWGCQRKPRGSRSSCEAEIYALDEGPKTVEMMRNIMFDLGLPDVAYATPLYNDNQGSVDWSRGVSLSKRLRHMNIRELGVRDSIRLDHTCVGHIPGHSNVSDIFTKEHKSTVTFTHLASQLIFPRSKLSFGEDSAYIDDQNPGGYHDDQDDQDNKENSRLTSLAKRGRIKGGAISHLDSPVPSVQTNTCHGTYIHSR